MGYTLEKKGKKGASSSLQKQVQHEQGAVEFREEKIHEELKKA